MSKKVSFINMIGNKKGLINDIFLVLGNNYDTTNYIEPFFGSGGAYCNLPIKFENYYCSDIFPLVIDFINAKYSPDILSTFYDAVFANWDIRNNKKDYYSFRKFWNLNKMKSDKLKNIGFILLASACINNIIRFGPNGFNSGYGNRLMSKQQLCNSYTFVKPNSFFYKSDFRDVSFKTQSLVYLDPPYSGTGAMTALFGFFQWAKKDDEDLLEKILAYRKTVGIVLSTIDESILERTLTTEGFSKFYFPKKKYKVTPWKFGAKNYREVILTNII